MPDLSRVSVELPTTAEHLPGADRIRFHMCIRCRVGQTDSRCCDPSMMSVHGRSSKPPTNQINLEKLRSVLDDMTIAFRRGQPLAFPPEFRPVEWGLVDFGCLGTWPDVAPLVWWIRGLGRLWQCEDDEAFDRFDQALDWVVAQPSPPPLWDE